VTAKRRGNTGQSRDQNDIEALDQVDNAVSAFAKALDMVIAAE